MNLSADRAAEFMPERNLWVSVVIGALTDWYDFHKKGYPREASNKSKWNKEKHLEDLRWFFFEPEQEEYNLQWIAVNVAKDSQAFIQAISYALEHGLRITQNHGVWDDAHYRRAKNLTVRKH
jgi:hypothetical protein